MVRTDQPIRIGLIKSDKAFSPEIEGYLDFFKPHRDMQARVYKSFEEADKNSDITIVFFGFIPLWKRHRSLIIAEYNSLSVGYLSYGKNILKRLFNIRGRVFHISK